MFMACCWVFNEQLTTSFIMFVTNVSYFFNTPPFSSLRFMKLYIYIHNIYRGPITVTFISNVFISAGFRWWYILFISTQLWHFCIILCFKNTKESNWPRESVGNTRYLSVFRYNCEETTSSSFSVLLTTQKKLYYHFLIPWSFPYF
jgi:hypothetical protein